MFALAIPPSYAELEEKVPEEREAPRSLQRRRTEIFLGQVGLTWTAEDIRSYYREFVNRRYYVFIIFLITWFTCGVFVLTHCVDDEDRLDLVQALYLLVQIITSVGYGDVHVHTVRGKIFISFLVLFGLLFAAAAVTHFTEVVYNSSTNVLKEHMRAGLKMVQRCATAKPVQEPLSYKVKRLRSAVANFLGFLLAGTLFFALYDNCVCEETFCDRDACEDKGGQRRTLVDAFYLSIVTLTTVGFGDDSPRSVEGQIFCIVWMLFGVMCTGNLVSEISHLMAVNEFLQMLDHDVDPELFDKMDTDNSGSLSRFEFVTYVLVKYGMVAAEDLDCVLERFDELDLDHNGKLTYADMPSADGRQRRTSSKKRSLQ
eukprot:TRINITY_DN22540_c0_g4_i1.p1 TRINITY_DN22540_c0_g4~~TRINITY_DN22540_c0_g4_i1.p1  ORF type:complete len:371 (+),score=59.45 TRINITY_DN22540_c0_g4_i1:24-1136(+)